MARRQEFVTYVSPGTFFAETTTKPIESRDVKMAIRMGKDIEERYGARPYCFFFSTRIVSDDVDDGEGGKLKVEPKEVDKSGNYFIGGRVFSYHDLVARDDKNEEILCTNMLNNDYAFIVENTNSYKSSVPFGPDDVVVDGTGTIIERGDDSVRMAYRTTFKSKEI